MKTFYVVIITLMFGLMAYDITTFQEDISSLGKRIETQKQRIETQKQRIEALEEVIRFFNSRPKGIPHSPLGPQFPYDHEIRES